MSTELNKYLASLNGNFGKLLLSNLKMGRQKTKNLVSLKCREENRIGRLTTTHNYRYFLWSTEAN